MRAAFYLCGALALATLSACSNDPSQPPPGNPADLMLPLGGSAVVPGTAIEVTFADVLADFRCPVDVVCCCAGNGQVLITAREGGGGDDETGRLILNTTEGPRAGEFGGYRFELTALEPLPDTRREAPPDYRVSLRVDPK